MTVIEELAELMEEAVDMLHLGEGGQIHIFQLPEEDVDRDVVALFEYGTMSQFPSPHDTHSIQAVVRGHDIDDTLGGYDLAHQIWDGLHGWIRPAGYEGSVELIAAAGPPISVGKDERKRSIWTISFHVEVRKDTKYRRW